MLDFPWSWLASSSAAVLFAALALGILIYLGYHREPGGRLGRRRMGSVIGLSASCYTFVICVFSQLVVKGPKISELIEFGFGNDRIALAITDIDLRPIFQTLGRIPAPR